MPSVGDGVRGRHFLLTNATEGVGLQAARELYAAGALVTITAASATRASEAAAQLRSEAGPSAAAGQVAGGSPLH